jgi:hypothetical protein
MCKRDVPILPLALCLALGACVTSRGTFGPKGYEQNTYHYQVAYARPPQQLVLGGDWRLDNLRMDEAVKKLVDKDGPEYVAARKTDDDGDGTIAPNEMHKEPIYDLRYVNARDGGVIWIKAHPLSAAEAALDLDVVLKSYADDLSGSGLYASANVFSVERPAVKQFISFVTGREPVRVGPNLGVSALIELAETERLRLDPRHRSSRLKVVMSKLAFQMPFVFDSPGASHHSSPWPTIQCAGGPCEQRAALLVAGYYNDVAHFAAAP